MVEYQLNLNHKGGLVNHNVPCSVCQADRRSTAIIIPAKVRCPDGSWTKEYSGYIMSQASPYHGSMFTCVDHSAEAVPGMAADINGVLFYYSSIECSTFGNCPPYKNHASLSCIVCTKQVQAAPISKVSFTYQINESVFFSSDDCIATPSGAVYYQCYYFGISLS